jgi:diguanylate cyclase (GGDEF)-like protein
VSVAKPGAKRKPPSRRISERKKPALRAVPAAVPSGDVDHREIDRLKAELAAARAQVTELEARADIDPLLDILNRRGFERELARSLAYVKRYGTDAVLLYIDLDDFKAINDHHGHAAGDELLKAVTATLTSQVRASDVIGRLGGDEFAVVLWNMSVAHAGGKARALEDIIAGATITRGADKLAVGASAGIAALSPLDTPAQAIDAADRAMYVRKREKRAGLSSSS